MAEHRSYYAIIPANIRYDTRLMPNAKLLYGEITALCNEKGYCWASNDYFADLYNVKKETISRWVSDLERFGYIRRSIVFKEGTKQIINRYIFLNQEGIDKKINTPIDEKVKDNNTSINNTFNNTKEYREDLPTSKKSKSKPVRHKYGEYQNVLLSDDQMEKLKSEFPNDWEQRIDRVSEYCELSGKTYKNYLATIRAWAKKDKQQSKRNFQTKKNYTRQEQLPDWAKEPVDYSSKKAKVTEEDRRRFLEDVGDEEGF